MPSNDLATAGEIQRLGLAVPDHIATAVKRIRDAQTGRFLAMLRLQSPPARMLAERDLVRRIDIAERWHKEAAAMESVGFSNYGTQLHAMAEQLVHPGVRPRGWRNAIEREA